MAQVLEIYIAATGSSVMTKMDQVQLETGKGIIGDRYYSGSGTFSAKLAGLPDREVTLIESENIDAFNREYGFDFGYGDFRRNIITKGVRLNDLTGQEFNVGLITLSGIRLCEPCAHLSGMLAPEILPAMVGKSGLRAKIINNGYIRPQDPIET